MMAMIAQPMKRPLMSLVALSAAISLLLVACSSDGSPQGQAAAGQTSDAVASQSQDALGVARSAEDATATATATASAEPGADEASEPSAPTPAPHSGTASESGSESGANSGAETPNYENDAGNDLREFTYDEDVEPAESVTATLCNLDQAYFINLRPPGGDQDFPADGLRLAVLSLGDHLSTWEGIIAQYPTFEDDLTIAESIYDYWDQALVAAENDDVKAAWESLRAGDTAIGELPEVVDGGEVKCVS